MTTMRTCVGCPVQLDLAAQLAATRLQPGWRRVCCGYLCPACWDTGHWPSHTPISSRTDAFAECGCGWRGDVVCERLADIETGWVAHYRQDVSYSAGSVSRR